MEPIDDVAVQRGMDGLTRLTHAEIREAILRMTWKKYSAREIASRLGITKRTVERNRVALRKEGKIS